MLKLSQAKHHITIRPENFKNYQKTITTLRPNTSRVFNLLASSKHTLKAVIGKHNVYFEDISFDSIEPVDLQEVVKEAPCMGFHFYFHFRTNDLMQFVKALEHAQIECKVNFIRKKKAKEVVEVFNS